MAEEKTAAEPAVRGNELVEENRRLAQRYLELEESSRRQLERLRSANALLARGEAHMRGLLENASIGFALLDLNLHVVSANRTLCGLLGCREIELTGDNFSNFVYVGKLSAFSRLTEGISSGTGSGETIELVARDGRLVPCRLAVSDWADENGARRGCFVLAFNMEEEMQIRTRLAELEETMAEMQKGRQFFLEVIARELHTPAGSIQGMARMLMDADLTERQAELAGVIHSSASSLLRLVDDMTDVLRMDSGGAQLEPLPFRPRKLAGSTAAIFGAAAEEKGLELRVAVDEKVPEYVVGDAARIRRILVKLLDNAMKYTDKGRITLAVDAFGETLRFMVSDTGSGIAHPEKDLFADGEGDDSPLSRRHGGTGMGLAICRRLAAVMGSRIDYETQPGRGSEFHFTIPLLDAAEVRQAADLEPPVEAMRLPPLSVLLADGSPISSRTARAYLEFDGHSVALVNNGLEAVERCRTGRYDVILLDLFLPKLDGRQTLKLIREDEKTSGRPRTPVLLMASSGRLRDADLCRQAGADGVAVKPIQPAELMQAIADAAGVEPLAVSRREGGEHYAAEASGSAVRRLDCAQLAGLRQVMPREQLNGMLRFFMEDAVPGLVAIQEMTGREEFDPQRVAFAAAKTRSFAGYLGFAALAELLGRIENAVRGGAGTDAVRALADELPLVIDDSLEELKRIQPEAFTTLSAMTGPAPAGQ